MRIFTINWILSDTKEGFPESEPCCNYDVNVMLLDMYNAVIISKVQLRNTLCKQLGHHGPSCSWTLIVHFIAVLEAAFKAAMLDQIYAMHKLAKVGSSAIMDRT